MNNCNLVGKSYGEKCSGKCKHETVCSVCGEEAVTFGQDNTVYCSNNLCDYMYHARNGHAPDLLREIQSTRVEFKDAPYLTYVFGKINHGAMEEDSSISEFLKSYVYFLVFIPDGDNFKLIGKHSLVRLANDTDNILTDGQTAHAVQRHVYGRRLQNAKDVYVSNTIFKMGESYTKEQLGVEYSNSLVLRFNNEVDKPHHQKENASYFVLVDGKLTPYSTYGVGAKPSELETTRKITTTEELYNVTYDYIDTFDVKGNTMHLVQGEYQDVPYLTYASEFKQLV